MRKRTIWQRALSLPTATWADDGSLWQAFLARVRHLAAEKPLDLRVLHGDGTHTVAQKGGRALAPRGTNTRKGGKGLAITDNNAYVLAPLPVAPVNETDMVLGPQGLNALQQVAKEVGLDLRGAYSNLDGGFDSRANRKCIFNAGMIPDITENPRNRKTTKRGRKRRFNKTIHAL